MRRNERKVERENYREIERKVYGKRTKEREERVR